MWHTFSGHVSFILPGNFCIIMAAVSTQQIAGAGLFENGIKGIGAKPNLYCEAIELVCGGSPKICVLVEGKALDRVKSEQ